MPSEFREQLKGTYHDYEKYEKYAPDTPVLYRAINPFSVGSVVVGLLSPVAYFHWGFLFVPLLGIALGIAGLVNLSRVEGAKLGIWLAGVGIGLCLLLGLGVYGLSVVYYHMAPPGYLAIGYETWNERSEQPLARRRMSWRASGSLCGYMYHAAVLGGAKSFVIISRQRRLPVLPAEPEKDRSSLHRVGRGTGSLYDPADRRRRQVSMAQTRTRSTAAWSTTSRPITCGRARRVGVASSDDGQNLALVHDQELFAIDVHLRAAVGREQTRSPSVTSCGACRPRAIGRRPRTDAALAGFLSCGIGKDNPAGCDLFGVRRRMTTFSPKGTSFILRHSEK